MKKLLKITESISRYKGPEIEIERIWDMEITAIPGIISGLGLDLVKKVMEKYTNKNTGDIKFRTSSSPALFIY